MDAIPHPFPLYQFLHFSPQYLLTYRECWLVKRSREANSRVVEKHPAPTCAFEALKNPTVFCMDYVVAIFVWCKPRCSLQGWVVVALATDLHSAIIMLNTVTEGGTNLRLPTRRRILPEEISLRLATCESTTSNLVENSEKRRVMR